MLPLRSISLDESAEYSAQAKFRAKRALEDIMVRFVPFVESQRWHARALECRIVADLFRDNFARERMWKAAANFENIAAETREREFAQGVLPWEDFCAN